MSLGMKKQHQSTFQSSPVHQIRPSSTIQELLREKQTKIDNNIFKIKAENQRQKFLESFLSYKREQARSDFHMFTQSKPSLLSLKFQNYCSLKDLVDDSSMIGIIGEQRLFGHEEFEDVEVISIGSKSEIPAVTCLRPYSFSNIFVINEKNNFPLQLLVKCQQTFTVKFSALDELEELLDSYERQILQEHGKKTIKNIIEKLTIRICQVQHEFWILFNCLQDVMEAEVFLYQKFIYQEENNIKCLSNIITVQEFHQLLQAKGEKQKESQINQIIQKFISSSLLSDSQSDLSFDPYIEIYEQNKSETSQLDIFSPPLQETLLKPESEKEESPRRRFRSRSAGMESETVRMEAEQHRYRLWNELLEVN